MPNSRVIRYDKTLIYIAEHQPPLYIDLNSEVVKQTNFDSR